MKIATYLIKEINYDEFIKMRDTLIWKYPLVYLSSEYMGHLTTARIVFQLDNIHLQSPIDFLKLYNDKPVKQIIVSFDATTNTIYNITERKVEL
jgi:hypothetical protein